MEHGLLSATMPQIGRGDGVSGARPCTKYFPDVEAILVAWHLRQGPPAHLEPPHPAARSGAGEPGERLEAVLEAYAHIIH